VQEVLSHPRVVRKLVKLMRATDDQTERKFLRGRLLPPPALAVSDPEAFRAHPLVNLTAEQLPIKPCLVLVELGPAEVPEIIGGWDAQGNLSWFAGLPADDGTGSWPRNEAGDPLSHIAQVDLGAYTWRLAGDDPTLSELLHVPNSGVLQLFHDRENYGNEDDEAAGSWLVRWVERPSRLLERPADLADDDYAPPVAMGAALVASVPSLVDYDGPGGDRYDCVAEHLPAVRRDEPHLFGGVADLNATMVSAWEKDLESLDGNETSLGGYGYHESSVDVQQTLDAKLPLTAGDEHGCCSTSPARGHLQDWFHDFAHLQAWMRASDRESRAFHRAWCIIRTD